MLNLTLEVDSKLNGEFGTHAKSLQLVTEVLKTPVAQPSSNELERFPCEDLYWKPSVSDTPCSFSGVEPSKAEK